MSHSEKVSINLRWITPVLGILTLLGVGYSIYGKPYRWDQAAAKVEEISKIVSQHEIAMAVIISQLKDMSQDLKEIKRAVK